MTSPIANNFFGPSTGNLRTWNGDCPPGCTACQASQSRYAAPAKRKRVIGVRHREYERGDAERRAQHVEDETERHAAERDQPRAQPCVIEREIK